MYSTTMILLSFEGPDPYASVGGISSRVCGLAEGLAGMGYETHLFFVGDPDLPPTEVRHNGRLHLHRWCQWLSAFHRGHAYDGEQDKVRDLSASLPLWLADNLIAEKIDAGGNVVVMAEEWQTAQSLVHLGAIIEKRRLSDRVYLLWNANSNNSLEAVPWRSLRKAAVITTVSRYMRTVLNAYGVEARVIPNGISESWLRPPGHTQRQMTNELFGGRVALAKPGAWDVAGTETALDAASIMKRMAISPLLIIGGIGDGGANLAAKAEDAGLRARSAACAGPSGEHLLEAIRDQQDADVVLLTGELTLPQRQLLFHAVTAVLATSGREPFGATGLEAMASGGVAVVGCSGEDYATPGHDSISVQSTDPWEIVHNIAALQDSFVKTTRLRRNAKQTAARYTWSAVIRRCLLPALSMIGVPRVELATPPRPALPASPVRQMTWRKGGHALARV